MRLTYVKKKMNLAQILSMKSEGKHLGRGVYGSVKLVRHNQTKYAVKRQIVNDLGSFECSVREEICGRLCHPNIVKRFSSWWSDYTWWGVFEVGETLQSSALHNRVLWDIVSALAFLHAHDIAHRDIKPDNIIQVSNGHEITYKLIDFGLARPLISTDRSQTGYVVSRNWRPVELIRGGVTDTRCDIWSLAVVCLTLKRGHEILYGSCTDILLKFKEFVFNSDEWIYSKMMCELFERWNAFELCDCLNLPYDLEVEPLRINNRQLKALLGNEENHPRYYKNGISCNMANNTKYM